MSSVAPVRRAHRLLIVFLLAASAAVATPGPALAAAPVAENLELAQTVGSSRVQAFDGGFIFMVDEAAQGVDLNGDGDTTDAQVAHVFRNGFGVTNLGVAVTGASGPFAQGDGGIMLAVSETGQQENLNGDADTNDTVVFAYSFTQGLINLGVATMDPDAVWQADDGFAFWVDEVSQNNSNLNGDGDALDDAIWYVWTPETGVVNLGLAATSFKLILDTRADGEGFLFAVNEAAQGNTDLNGDTDTNDGSVWFFWDPVGGVTNLELAAGSPWAQSIDGGVAFLVSEAQQVTDFNGDTDISDLMWHSYRASDGAIVNTGVASTGTSPRPANGGLAFLVSEASDGTTGDLNGDGVQDDSVLYFYDLASGLTNLGLDVDDFTISETDTGFGFMASETGQAADLNGDGDMTDTRVWHVFDDGTVTNLQRASSTGSTSSAGSGFVFFADETLAAPSTDFNGDSDFTDVRVIHLWTPEGDLLNLAYAVTGTNEFATSGDLVMFGVVEEFQGMTDFGGTAGDGDIIWFVHRIGVGSTNLALITGASPKPIAYDGGIAFPVREGGTILNGDGDTTDTGVWHTYDLVNGVTNLGVATEQVSATTLTAGFGNGFGFTGSEVAQGANLNGDADSTDLGVWHVVTLPYLVRYAGANRYGTAAAAAAGDFSDAHLVSTVFVAVGTDFPDALAGAAIAGKMGAPLLLVQTNSIPAETIAQLTRLDPDTIVILGGTGVVSSAVETALGAYGTTVRLAGANRYLTAIEISKYGFDPAGSGDIVYVATGTGFADALAAAPAAIVGNGPLLLTPPDSLPAAVAAEITRLTPDRIVVVGGTSAISDTVFDALVALVENTQRVSGANRYATAVAISEDAFPGGAPRAYVATGLNFPDALAGAGAAGFFESPVLLIPGTSLPGSVSTEIDRLDPKVIVILGGTAVVTTGVETALKAPLGL